MAVILRNKSLSTKLKPVKEFDEDDKKETKSEELIEVIEKLTAVLDKPKSKVNLKATIQRDEEGRMSSIIITDI
jgi:hypothetical protein